MPFINTPKILKEIKNGEWYVVGSGPLVPFFCYTWVIANAKLKKLIGKGNEISIFPISHEFGHQVLRKKESLSLGKKLLDDMLYCSKRIDKLLKDWDICKKTLVAAMDNLDNLKLSKLKSCDLCDIFDDFFDKSVNSWILCLSTDSFHIFAQKYVEDLAKKQKRAPVGKFQELAQELSLSDKKYFFSEEKENLYKIALRHYGDLKNIKKFKDAPPGLKSGLKEHAKNYFWIQNNYKRAKILTAEYFWKEAAGIAGNNSLKSLKSALRKFKNYATDAKIKKSKIVAKLNLTERDKAFFKLAALWSELQDEKKKLALLSNHFLFSFAGEFAKRLKMPLNEFYVLSPKEIREALLENKKIFRKTIKDRISRGVFISVPSGATWISSKNAKKIWQLLFPKNKSMELKGMVASTGGIKKCRGVIQIILDPDKSKFKKGNILATSMTRPEFVPLMKKVKAIIANEGGVTSHAAIVSRELNIPCIIGTKNATDVLKNGDLVEMDMGSGVIKILKKNE